MNTLERKDQVELALRGPKMQLVHESPEHVCEHIGNDSRWIPKLSFALHGIF
jgi:hypothetical protein